MADEGATSDRGCVPEPTEIAHGELTRPGVASPPAPLPASAPNGITVFNQDIIGDSDNNRTYLASTLAHPPTGFVVNPFTQPQNERANAPPSSRHGGPSAPNVASLCTPTTGTSLVNHNPFIGTLSAFGGRRAAGTFNAPVHASDVQRESTSLSARAQGKQPESTLFTHMGRGMSVPWIAPLSFSWSQASHSPSTPLQLSIAGPLFQTTFSPTMPFGVMSHSLPPAQLGVSPGSFTIGDHSTTPITRHPSPSHGVSPYNSTPVEVPHSSTSVPAQESQVRQPAPPLGFSPPGGSFPEQTPERTSRSPVCPPRCYGSVMSSRSSPSVPRSNTAPMMEQSDISVRSRAPSAGCHLSPPDAGSSGGPNNGHDDPYEEVCTLVYL